MIHLYDLFILLIKYHIKPEYDDSNNIDYPLISTDFNPPNDPNSAILLKRFILLQCKKHKLRLAHSSPLLEVKIPSLFEQQPLHIENPFSLPHIQNSSTIF